MRVQSLLIGSLEELKQYFRFVFPRTLPRLAASNRIAGMCIQLNDEEHSIENQFKSIEEIEKGLQDQPGCRYYAIFYFEVETAIKQEDSAKGIGEVTMKMVSQYVKVEHA